MSSLLLRRVRLVPLNGPVAADLVDVLIEDGFITGIGAVVRPGGVPVVDGDGRWLIPGLWDAHVHLGQWALARRRLDLSRTSSPRDVLALVAQAARQGRPVVGTGYRAGTWARQVTVAELDAVCGQVPVVLVNSDCHHGWLNTAGLDALGLARRDGTVAEAEWFAAYPRLADLEGHPAAADYRRVLGDAAARGVVGLVDFEFGAPWSDWARRWHEGCDLLRIRWSPYAGQLDSVRASGLRSGAALPGADDRLTVGSLKIISDGSLGTRTAWCREPYAVTGGFGGSNLPEGELAGLLAEGRRLGLSVATHAIGDRAVAAALAAYAATGARGSVEHAQLTTAREITEMSRLGLVASVQPAHLLDDRPMMDRVWPDRADRCFMLRSMLDQGVEVALGSDAPVAPLDPWLAIAAAVHRGPPGDEPWHPEQAITTAEAIAAATDGRRIAVGQPGDVVLVDSDPLASDAAGLRAMHVALTCVAGRIVHGGLPEVRAAGEQRGPVARRALAGMRVACAFTVRTLISRDDAISAVIWPSAVARATSSSRGSARPVAGPPAPARSPAPRRGASAGGARLGKAGMPLPAGFLLAGWQWVRAAGSEDDAGDFVDGRLGQVPGGRQPAGQGGSDVAGGSCGTEHRAVAGAVSCCRNLPRSEALGRGRAGPAGRAWPAGKTRRGCLLLPQPAEE